uniref:Uncharacterized protein n=1 Tax=Caenorhabditis japonica TaxID=281687 RepID=A0A8R1ERG3_CAEJA
MSKMKYNLFLQESFVETKKEVKRELVSTETREEAERAVKIIRRDLDAAGVCIAEEKSCWEPSEQFTWLGVRCDLVARTVRLTEKREISLRNQIEMMKGSLAPSILDRQKLCGYLSSMTVIAGDEAIARQRHLSSVVARSQTDAIQSRRRFNLLPG